MYIGTITKLNQILFNKVEFEFNDSDKSVKRGSHMCGTIETFIKIGRFFSINSTTVCMVVYGIVFCMYLYGTAASCTYPTHTYTIPYHTIHKRLSYSETNYKFLVKFFSQSN